MNKEFDRKWLKKHAALEDGGFVSVGGFISTFEEKSSAGEEPVGVDALKHAFVKLLQLKRRERKLSVEELAAKADLDMAELLRIESDEGYVAAPFSVHKLAEFFKLPERPLMALAGLLKVKDAQFQQQALRFAARSEPVEKLSKEEHRALEEYVKFLCER
jgi:transcriptional regulator with XRE-family HTH domain